MSRLRAVRLDDLSLDEQIKYKTRLQSIDRILSLYEKGKIAKLATDKRYSVNLIITALSYKRGVLKQVLEDINMVMNGLSEYADIREIP
jgi:tagatose-1,6-bisphosphate aldolase